MNYFVFILLFCFGVAISDALGSGSNPAAPSSAPLHLYSPSDIGKSLEQCLMHAKGKLQNDFRRFSVCHAGTADSSAMSGHLRKFASTVAMAGAIALASRAIASRWIAIKAGEEVVCDDSESRE